MNMHTQTKKVVIWQTSFQQCCTIIMELCSLFMHLS